ncbi:MAG: FHA domain-containing protein [Planctomycetota bacterium]|nr:FHA domain-containing protein [Planctomycetota bacterium]MDA1139903.1 FHA domain-containing protein [Planctomycetota bacterium]
MANLPPIPGHCPKCGYYNEFTARFCAQCGSGVTSDTQQPAGLEAPENDPIEFTGETTATVPVAIPPESEPSVGLNTALSQLEDAEDESAGFGIETTNPATLWRQLDEIPTIQSAPAVPPEPILDETTIGLEMGTSETTEAQDSFTEATTVRVNNPAIIDEEGVDFMEDSSDTDTISPLWDTAQTHSITEDQLLDEKVREPKPRGPLVPGTHQEAIPTLKDDEGKGSPCVLYIPGENGKFETFRLSNAPRLAGKHEKCELLINDPLASRFHVMFQMLGDRHYVIDVKSRLGTLLNGESIMQAALRDGDTLRVGKTYLIYFGRNVSPEEKIELRGAGDSFVPVAMEFPLAGEPRLAFLKGQEISLCFPGVPCVIGAHQACSCRLHGNGIAPFHAQILWTKGEPHLLDLGSGFGTFLNRESVEQTLIRSGDEIQLGDQTFTARFVKNPPPILFEVSETASKVNCLWFTCLRGPDKGLTQILASGEKPLNLGRHSSNDVVLTDSEVAGRHASVSKEGHKVLVQDLTGRKLTIINGSPSPEGRLVPGQLFKIGHDIFLVHYDISAKVYR